MADLRDLVLKVLPVAQGLSMAVPGAGGAMAAGRAIANANPPQAQMSPINQQSLMWDVGFPGVQLSAPMMQRAQAYNANPTGNQWLGVDPAQFGYPADHMATWPQVQQIMAQNNANMVWNQANLHSGQPLRQLQQVPQIQMQPLPQMQPMGQGFQFGPSGQYMGGGGADAGIFNGDTQLGPTWNPGYLSNNPQF